MNRLKDFDELRQEAGQRAKQFGPLKLALACAEHTQGLAALREAADLGLIRPILVGDARKIEQMAADNEINISDFELVNEADLQRAAAQSAHLVAAGQADLLMKGKLMAQEILEAALHAGAGMRSDRRLWTHVGIFWPQWLSRFLLVSDGGVVIDPKLEEIPKIIDNAVEVAEILGIVRPRVALLAAVETVYPNMPVAMGGAVIAKMAQRGQIRDAVVDGPLSLDVALSEEAAQEKKVGGEVAGRADILVVNKIEVGNGLCKSIFLFGHARSASLVVGPKTPIILTSRSESVDARVNSIALATLMVRR